MPSSKLPLGSSRRTNASAHSKRIFQGVQERPEAAYKSREEAEANPPGDPDERRGEVGAWVLPAEEAAEYDQQKERDRQETQAEQERPVGERRAQGRKL